MASDYTLKAMEAAVEVEALKYQIESATCEFKAHCMLGREKEAQVFRQKIHELIDLSLDAEARNRKYMAALYRNLGK